jgi:hypothetical protein
MQFQTILASQIISSYESKRWKFEYLCSKLCKNCKKYMCFKSWLKMEAVFALAIDASEQTYFKINLNETCKLRVRLMYLHFLFFIHSYNNLTQRLLL